MIDGDCSITMFFLYYYRSTQANLGIHGEKTASMGSNGRIKMIFLYLIYTHALAG